MSQELPRYKCHKEVRAAKIDIVEHLESGSVKLHFAKYESIEVDGEWLAKHHPFAGGYYVVYKDGYTSYSPAEAFEEGYTLVV